MALGSRARRVETLPAARRIVAWAATISDGAVSIWLGAGAAVVFLCASLGHPTVYDYFGRLALAFRRGEWWLDDAPPHLNELVEGVGGHVYSVTPPMPAILLIPIVGFLGPAVAQTSLSAILGGLSALPIFRAQRALDVPRALAIWTTVLSTFGTTLFVTAVDGRSWFTGDVIAFFFASVALWCAAARGPILLTGAALGAAALTRTPLALAAAGVLLLQLRDTPRSGLVPALARFAAGALPFAVIYVSYDLARWGTPWDVGYALLSAEDPLYTRGLFSPSYLPRHLYAMLFEPPAFVDDHLLFLRARSIGMSLLFATPAMLWLARAALVGRSFAASFPLGLACLTIGPDVLFGTVGFEQYAYRRSLDAQAFVVPLLAVGGGWTGSGWLRSGSTLFRVAVVLSVATTLYFFVTIRLFGFS